MADLIQSFSFVTLVQEGGIGANEHLLVVQEQGVMIALRGEAAEFDPSPR